MRIGITYNLKNDTPPFPGIPFSSEQTEEFDLPETVEAIQAVLTGEGNEVFLLGGDIVILEKIERNGVDFVFNIAEGFHGRSREIQIPSLLEMRGIPYSGSDSVGLAMTLDKSLAKRIAISLGIPTPEFWILEEKEETQKIPDRFPLFVKPLWQGSSIGIRRSSRVTNRYSLEGEVNRLFEGSPEEPVLVEGYIPGRECTVAVLGNRQPEILGTMEIAFRDPAQKDFCYSLEVKRNWKKEVEYRVPAPLKPATKEGIHDATLRLFKALRLRDVARFDFRVNEEGKFYFLEVNPLPGLSPDSGDLVILVRKKGWSYQELILKIAQTAMARYPKLSKLSKSTKLTKLTC